MTEAGMDPAVGRKSKENYNGEKCWARWKLVNAEGGSKHRLWGFPGAMRSISQKARQVVT